MPDKMERQLIALTTYRNSLLSQLRSALSMHGFDVAQFTDEALARAVRAAACEAISEYPHFESTWRRLTSET